MYKLRRATIADTELLWTTQCETLSEYITKEFGTDLQGQRAFFDENFQVLSHELILVDAAVVGHLYVEQRLNSVYLANIAVRPTHQSQGLGTKVVSDIMDRAAKATLPVRLQVTPSNPAAYRLYTRLGFVATGRDEHHIFMEWKPTQSS